ncbi:uncharacterized protein LOC131665409 [Phymastichus coffea]|uniref:uncharacterized protein LOC131665409 n=1 Tax=Phymastichus coffea TaxID=108790 RepID=UPI00273B8E1C|nr:uncharacterized protein LOC131665409 [Phymastichus coffea]
MLSRGLYLIGIFVAFAMMVNVSAKSFPLDEEDKENEENMENEENEEELLVSENENGALENRKGGGGGLKKGGKNFGSGVLNGAGHATGNTAVQCLIMRNC